MPPDRTHRHRRTTALRAAARPGDRSATVRVAGGGTGLSAATLELDTADDRRGGVTAAGPAVDTLVEVEVTADGCYSHDELLSLARSVQAATVGEDVAELIDTVRRLHDGLRCHVASEREGQDHLPAALRAVVFGGQDRLLRLVEQIALDLVADGGYACVRYGAELVVALRRQAALEAAALRRPSDLGPATRLEAVSPGRGSPKLS
ncbi:MAG TPA: hypothetical protein VFZ79_19280 [Acidimicrobiales bacterium]